MLINVLIDVLIDVIVDVLIDVIVIVIAIAIATATAVRELIKNSLGGPFWGIILADIASAFIILIGVIAAPNFKRCGISTTFPRGPSSSL